MFLGCLRELEWVSVMLPGGIAIYAYIVMYVNYAGETVCCLVHSHLKDDLGHLQTKCHVQEIVPPKMGIECGQVGRFLIEVYVPEAVFSVQLAEAGGTAESVRDFVKCRGFITLSHNGLVKVLRVEAYV